MNLVKRFKLSLIIFFSLACVMGAGQTALAAGNPNSPSADCQLAKPAFFFFPPWWEYLKGTLVPPPSDPNPAKLPQQCLPAFDFPSGFIAVALAIIDMLLRLAGFIAIISIIIAGAQYIFGAGNPEKGAAARWRLYNSLIGLGIVAAATAAVTFIGKQFS